MNDAKRKLKRQIALSLFIVVTVLCMFGIVNVTGVFAQNTDESARQEISAERAGVMKYGLIAAAIAFGLGAIGAGLAIGNVGAAAMGAIAEKPEIASQALIFIALAEGLVIFGFITALMILGKI